MAPLLSNSEGRLKNAQGGVLEMFLSVSFVLLQSLYFGLAFLFILLMSVKLLIRGTEKK